MNGNINAALIHLDRALEDAKCGHYNFAIEAIESAKDELLKFIEREEDKGE